jgi:hypothetical protein
MQYICSSEIVVKFDSCLQHCERRELVRPYERIRRCLPPSATSQQNIFRPSSVKARSCVPNMVMKDKTTPRGLTSRETYHGTSKHARPEWMLNQTSLPRIYLIIFGPVAIHTASPSIIMLDICSSASGPGLYIMFCS